jgi:hypothetical protein
MYIFQVGYTQSPAPNKMVLDLLVLAKNQMQDGKYVAASFTFRKMLETNEVLPTEMAYYFAETLYMTGQYQNSKNFLEKYTDLTGGSGDFYKQSLELEKLLAAKTMEIEACNLCDNHGYRLHTCPNCQGEKIISQTCAYCKGQGISICTACEGGGVIISENVFGENEYKTCTQCNNKGFVPCPICLGVKKTIADCRQCHGNGSIATKDICDHQPENTTF